MLEFSFFAALTILAYTFAGYPALMWALARAFPRPVRRASLTPRVAVVIVARNEAARIAAKIESCLASDYPAGRLRIVVASDGSEDATCEVVRGFAGRGVTLLEFAGRRGKAACLNDAVAACDEEILVFTDARQRLDRAAVASLVGNFADPAVGAASGELVFETDGITGFGSGVDFYWRYEKFIRRQESAFSSAVGVTGAIYALRRECFRPLPADTILDDVLVPMNAVTSGRRVVFDPLARAYDRPSRDPAQERVRKVRTLAGNYQLVSSHPHLLVPWRNPIFFQLVSHKLLRLVAPYLLVAVLAANAALAARSATYQLMLAAQLLGYALAVTGLALPAARDWTPVRLSSAFLVLNSFAVMGLIEFLRNRRAHLWDTRGRQ